MKDLGGGIEIGIGIGITRGKVIFDRAIVVKEEEGGEVGEGGKEGGKEGKKERRK